MSELLKPPIARSQRPRFDLAVSGGTNRKLQKLETAIASYVWRFSRSAAKYGAMARGFRSGPKTAVQAKKKLPELLKLAAKHHLVSGENKAGIELAGRALIDGHLLECLDDEARTAALVCVALAFSMSGRKVVFACANNAQAAHLQTAWQPVCTDLEIFSAAVQARSSNEERRVLYRANLVFADVYQLATDHLRDVHAGLKRRAMSAHKTRVLAQGSQARELFMLGALDVAVVQDFADIAVDSAGRMVLLRDGMELLNADFLAREAIDFARRLRKGHDFEMAHTDGLRLTDTGRKRAEVLAVQLSEPWSIRRWREPSLLDALDIMHFKTKHKDYAIVQGQVRFSGADQAYPQRAGSFLDPETLVLTLEGQSEHEGEVVSEMSLRQFLSEFRHLIGASTPAAGNAGDFWRLYGLTSFRSGKATVSQGGKLRVALSKDEDDKWDQINTLVSDNARSGIPTLLVASASTESSGLIYARMGTALHSHIKVVSNRAALEEALTDKVLDAVFVEANQLRARTVMLNSFWRTRPGETAVLYTSWQEPIMAALADSPFAGRVGNKVLASKYLLSMADKRAAKIRKSLQRDALRWETAVQNAFGFTGGKES